MASVLFVHPLSLSENPDEVAAASPYFPLGLLYLAAYVRERGHTVAMFDATFETGTGSFLSALEEMHPDVVAISAVATSADAALDHATIAHDRGHLTILGGPDPTAWPAVYAEHRMVDLVVHHEGEETLQRVLDLHDDGGWEAGALRNEAGLAFTDGADIVVTPPRPPIEDLDTLPTPARDLIDMNRHLDWWRTAVGYSSLTLSTSRGCRQGCRWCTDAVHGSGFRQRSPEHVAAEMAEIDAAYDLDRLRLVDDVDGLDRAWLESWAAVASASGTAVRFEALNELQRRDIPLLEMAEGL